MASGRIYSSARASPCFAQLGFHFVEHLLAVEKLSPVGVGSAFLNGLAKRLTCLDERNALANQLIRRLKGPMAQAFGHLFFGPLAELALRIRA